MIRKNFLLVFTAILISAIPATAQKNAPDYKSMATDIFKLVNKHRAEMNLRPLAWNDVIAHGAWEHSKNMGDGTIPFSHVNLDERVAKICKQMKVHASGWAENVATGAHTAQQAVAMWLKSQGHRENIEGDYGMTGIGIVKGKDGSLYFTEIFIKKG